MKKKKTKKKKTIKARRVRTASFVCALCVLKIGDSLAIKWSNGGLTITECNKLVLFVCFARLFSSHNCLVVTFSQTNWSIYYLISANELTRAIEKRVAAKEWPVGGCTVYAIEYNSITARLSCLFHSRTSVQFKAEISHRLISNNINFFLIFFIVTHCTRAFPACENAARKSIDVCTVEF